VELTYKQLKEYIQCPLMFKLKHLTGFKDVENLYDHYNASLVKTLQQFYYAIMDKNTIISEDALRQKWEHNFCEDKAMNPQHYMLKPIYGSVIDTRNRVRSPELDLRTYTVDGWGLMQTFHRNNKSEPGYPILIDHEYRINIGEDAITGKIDLVRTVNDKAQLIVLDTRKYQPHPFEIENNMDVTLQAYAFTKMFGETPEINYYFVKKNEFIPTVRTKTDVEKSIKIAQNILKSVKMDIYYPRQTTYCQGCRLQDLCSKWDGK
jgi:CRISPR/Cas system-associated exonuclease Cas4 (RecB family)